MKLTHLIPLVALIYQPVAFAPVLAIPIVSPKIILQVQPFVGQLGTHFPSNPAYTDSGYVFLGSSFEGTAATVLDFTTVKPYLEQGRFGIVQFGSHGGSDHICIEWRLDPTDAATRILWLETWRYFQQGQLVPTTITTTSGTTIYGIAAWKAYFDTAPAASDVAIVASCDGQYAGHFNATHKLGGIGQCLNVEHYAAHNALLAGMKLQNIKTIAVAHAQYADISDAWSLSGTTGDIKFFFECDPSEGSLVEGYASTSAIACDKDPAAFVTDFNYHDGLASWTVDFEWETVAYVLEGYDRPGGPAAELGRDHAGTGSHSVRLPRDQCRWLQLVEVEKGGRREIVAVCSTRASSPLPPPQHSGEDPLIERRREISADAKAIRTLQHLVPSSPTCVVYALPALIGAMESQFAQYWNARGENVVVVGVPSSAEENDVAGWIQDDVRQHATNGVSHFLLVGDWDDDCSSPLWHSSTYWEAKYDTMLAGGRIPTQPANSIPPFLIPDAELEGRNTARHFPYVYSDRPYADVDDDGLPDVVVTRWPFRSADDVLVACENMKNFDNVEILGQGPRKAAFLIDDTSSSEPGATVVNMASQLTDLVESQGGTVATLFKSDLLSDWDNAETVALMNSMRPDVIGLLSSTVSSGWAFPGGFFFNGLRGDQWDMSDVTEGWFVRAVVAASCETGKYVPFYDSIAYEDGIPYVAEGPPDWRTYWDFAVYKDFLATPDRGCITWIGPTTGTYQGGNYIVERFILEELYAKPYRPMGASWLAAMRRAYMYCQDFPDYIPTLDSYAFLGNPLTSFQPPVFVAAPLDGQALHGIVTVAGSVSSLESGIGASAALDSFSVEWRPSDLQEWNQYGVTYAVPRDGGVQSSTLATWDTGVVPSGSYVLRLIAYCGSDSYQVNHLVEVQHRATTVGSGAAFANLWDANNWAEVGDTLYISPGVYQNAMFGVTIPLKQSVRVIAEGAVELRPHLDRPVMSISNHGFPATIEGIVFKGMAGNDSCAVRVTDSRVTFKNCKFERFQAAWGSAVSASGKSSIVLADCEFVDNLGYEVGNIGSVLDLVATANGKPTLTATACVFRDNYISACRAQYLSIDPLQGPDTAPRFDGCRFEDNQAGPYVVGVENSLNAVEFSGCLFVDNSLRPMTSVPASVIYCNNASATLSKCTIADNVRNGWCFCSDPVGAVRVGGGGSPSISIDASIIANNLGPSVFSEAGTTPAGAMLTDCVVFGNAAYASARTDEQWASVGENVVNEDPAFCNAASGDHELYAFSPAAAGANGEQGPHFSETVGALGVGCVPGAVVTSVTAGTIDPPGVTYGCPQGDRDALIVRIEFDPAVMSRTIEPSEIHIAPPYLPIGVYSDATIHGSTQATSSNGYVMELYHPHISGYGSHELTVYLNSYPLEQKAVVVHRGPDFKSAGAPGPAPCAGDTPCPDGKVTNADYSWFTTHYPTAGNPSAPYFEACDYRPPFAAPIGLADLSEFTVHFAAAHKHLYGDPLLQTAETTATVSTHVDLSFTEEFVTALSRRLYVDVTLEDCADENWCVFGLRSNRSDLTFLAWEPSDWAAGSAPFVPLDGENGRDLYFHVIMINDTGESTRRLGRLVYEIAGSEPLSFSDEHFALTMGEIELTGSGDSGQSLTYARMNGVLGRTLDSRVERIFHDRLEQNFPNPFNPQTTLAYSLKAATHVSLLVYDVAGRRVRELVNEHRQPGTYRVVWDGRDGNGTQVASGVLFYKLVAGSFADTKKMIMLK